ncbi:DUF6665 family protein [Chelativorans sp. YIM 93263]|uniref:DUF6665 family protein n=1 Tax=Chelativorans sp. YIM 93263 TaxID=2906648 RepID=UPI0023799D42|nr:DUF6665 family protein [Chelativorans sp. YIM 93263]
MLRPPAKSGSSAAPHTGVAELDYELAGEMAGALGRAGRRAEVSLARLAACDDVASERERRKELLQEAAEAVHAYFIQRELCGLRRHDDVIRGLAIPRAVLARLGAR